MRLRWRRALILTSVLAVSALATSTPAWASYNVSANCQAGGAPVPCNGWHTSPIQLYWTWTPYDNGMPAPGSCVTQSFGSDTSTVVSCDVSGASGLGGTNQPIDVETSAPTASVVPARPPDSGGWYNHPVGIAFSGSSFSGIASCTPGATYAGPDVANATISGTCVDNAGKTANTSISLNYDATPPTIMGALPSRPPDSNGYYTHPVTFHFMGTDAGSGIAGCDTVTYSGPASGSVLGGCHDRAGNYATSAVPVRYRPPTPRASITRVKSSLILRWRPAARASYYNIQIYRGGKKVLSTWPGRTSLVLPRSWSFAGHRFRLKPGRYRWYVWPGYGSRAAARYGRMIVSATFRVTKPF